MNKKQIDNFSKLAKDIYDKGKASRKDHRHFEEADELIYAVKMDMESLRREIQRGIDDVEPMKGVDIVRRAKAWHELLDAWIDFVNEEEYSWQEQVADDLAVEIAKGLRVAGY